MSSKYQPLYLKHRPQTLEELVGQQSVVQTLKNALDSGRISHAYLFTGPRGTGKTSSARILAKSINCQEGPTITPCLTCTSCIEIKESNSPSVFEIDAASNNSVDDARTLIERAPLVAQGGRKKLYIVDECHMLTKEAFNALLKTIEEPPPNVIFILATTEENKVPPTIVSRCQRLMFRLVNQEDLIEHLRNVAKKEEIAIAEDALELIARKAAGGLRDALGLLDQASLLARPGEKVKQADLLVLLGALHEDVLLQLSDAVAQKDGRRLIENAGKILAEGREPSLIALELAKHFLNLAKASYAQCDKSDIAELRAFILGTDPYIEGLIAQTAKFERAELSSIIEQLDRLDLALKRSSMPSLALEMGLLSICHRHEINTINQLSTRIAQLEEQLATGRISARAQSGPTPNITPNTSPNTTPSQTPGPAPVIAQNPVLSTAGQANIETARDDFKERNSPSTNNGHDQKVVDSSNKQVSSASQRQATNETAVNEEQSKNEPVNPSQSDENPGLGAESQGSTNILELEEMWSNLLETIHKRSIPAYSLVSMHAFPVRVESDTLLLGVRKEFFQKSIENKASAIEDAYLTVTGKTIRVMVKVLHDDTPEPRRATVQTKEPPPRAPSQAPRIQNQAREPESPRSADAGESSNSTNSKESSDDESEGERVSREEATINIDTDLAESSLIKEAYGLFEGPGSRMIG